MAKLTLQKLNSLYEKAKRCDEKLFAEQRTNILLRAGNHYNNKRMNNMFGNIRSKGQISKDNKIRLTKNHIHRITNIYKNYVLAASPSVSVKPFNDNELHDVKVAEQCQGIIDWVKKTNRWEKKQNQLASNFVNLGEVLGKVRFDYSKGQPYAVDEEGKPVKNGEFVIDRVFAFDVKRDPGARDWDSIRWLIEDTLVDMEEAKRLVSKLNPEKLEALAAGREKMFKVFDTNSGEYKDAKDQVLIKEMFVKPTDDKPNGQFIMFTQEFIIHTCDLPFGIWPWAYAGFDEQEGNARSSSIIRVCRPYQVEINRSASKMAEHQITLGDDKVYIQKGTKISNGGFVSGVRAIQYSGKEPSIQSGRSGDQYLKYSIQQTQEMYEAVNLAFIMEAKPQNGDAFAQLYQSMQHKNRFVEYGKKYEQFEIEIFEIVLKMAKKYLTEQHLIKIHGKAERVNIPEFKQEQDGSFEVTVEATSSDPETKFGRMLKSTQILQYAGSSLAPDQLGNIIKNLDLGNDHQMFSTLTIDQDNAENLILSMDRGEQPFISQNDDPDFMLRALNHRMKQADFRHMDPQIQQMYSQVIQAYTQIKQQQLMVQQQLSQGFIPSGGFLTTVNASWNNPATGKVERIKVPSESILWLTEALSKQGLFTQQMQSLPPQAQEQLALSQSQSLPQVSSNTAASQ